VRRGKPSRVLSTEY